jgi:hypothetical protein
MVHTDPLGAKIAALSAWIDAFNADRDPEAQLWGRIAKIQEEAGETIAALIGLTGGNPRKGVTHTADDVVKELLDCAVTALGAAEHLVGNDGSCLDRLGAHVDRLVNRAGISAGQPTSNTALAWDIASPADGLVRDDYTDYSVPVGLPVSE